MNEKSHITRKELLTLVREIPFRQRPTSEKLYSFHDSFSESSLVTKCFRGRTVQQVTPGRINKFDIAAFCLVDTYVAYFLPKILVALVKRPSSIMADLFVYRKLQEEYFKDKDLTNQEIDAMRKAREFLLQCKSIEYR